MDNGDVIRAGDTVIVRMHDDKSTSMLKVQGEQKICRSKVSTKQLVGAPYGSVFMIIADRKLQLVKDEEEDDILKTEASDDINDTTADELLRGDNRGYIDSNTAQKLSNEDIQKLRDSGASGKQIIASLIANSDTWASKTEFAQEKWLKRKQKKYIRCMRIVKSCPATVCEVYHTKNKEKICGLRWDSLAQVLSAGGVHSGSRVLVFDSVLGLAVGSVAYRLRGRGVVLAAYAGQQPHFEIVNSLNLDAESLAVIQTVPSEELGPAAAHIKSKGFGVLISQIEGHVEGRVVGETAMTSKVGVECLGVLGDVIVVGADVVEMSGTNGVTNAASSGISSSVSVINSVSSVIAPVPRVYPPSKPHHGSGRQQEPLIRLRDELRQGVDSLIIACKYDPLPILKTALTLLVPSSPFVVYCEFCEPLVECYLYVTDMNLAVKVSLSDTWSREFQTLPGRVHPQMFMSTSSGYILSGVYVGNSGTEKKIEKTEKLMSNAEDETSNNDSEGIVEQSHGTGNAGESSDTPVSKRGRRR